MKIISLEEIKQNARIEDSTEDTLISEMGEAAEQTVFNIIERDYDELVALYGSVPADIKRVCLMIATHFYENRSVTNPTALYNVPYTADMILKPYINFNRHV